MQGMAALSGVLGTMVRGGSAKPWTVLSVSRLPSGLSLQACQARGRGGVCPHSAEAALLLPAPLQRQHAPQETQHQAVPGGERGEGGRGEGGWGVELQVSLLYFIMGYHLILWVES